jgi:hypothetical protein
VKGTPRQRTPTKLWCWCLAALWATIGALALLSPWLTPLGTWTRYGRALVTASAAVSRWSVPKAAFAHFYLLGSAVNAATLAAALDLLPWRLLQGYLAPFVPLLPCGVYVPAAGVLFQLHLARRVAECRWLHVFSPSARMPLPVYLGGLAHYALAPLSFFAAAHAVHEGGNGGWRSSDGGDGGARSVGLAPPTATHAGAWVGLALVVAGSVGQCAWHAHLAGLRGAGRPPTVAVATSGSAGGPPAGEGNSVGSLLAVNAAPPAPATRSRVRAAGTAPVAPRRDGAASSGSDGGAAATKYLLPTWRVFAVVACPHYTAEIAVYTGLWLVCVGLGPAPTTEPLGWAAWATAAPTPLALALWSTVNLAVTSGQTWAWYHKHFGPGDGPSAACAPAALPRWAVLPGVW